MIAFGEALPKIRARTDRDVGRLQVRSAEGGLGEGSVTVVGRSDLRRAFGGWIGVSPFASPRSSAVRA
jgi:hypothetical protein